MADTGRVVFEYAVVRVVPRVERGERLNAGVVLWCQPRRWLGAVVRLDPDRLRALDPGVDVDAVATHLDALTRTCRGDGPAGAQPPGERFRWLTAPRSTVVQPGPVHSGLTDDPAAELERLAALLVSPPTAR